MSPPRVVILGGGMAGLAAAWELSQGHWRDRVASITVYQRGWRLGGKGASSRSVDGRIEEHGLHVLLGYYDATFRLLRQVYGELDRPRTDPGCPIRTWQDAVKPTGLVGLAENHDGDWLHFVTRFSSNDSLPGEPGAPDEPLRPLAMATRALGLLMDFHLSLATASGPGVYLSGSPQPRRDVGSLVRGAGVTVLAGLRSALDQLGGEGTGPLATVLDRWREQTRRWVEADPHARRTWHLVDLVLTNLRGMLADGLLSGDRFETIDHLDYRQWLQTHGAGAETVDSPIVRGMYDLTFAYEAGDRSRPRFAAGLGLQLAFRMLFDFKGSIFWRMEAGMGEVVFAPLYQALRERGVEFRFFHRLDDVRPGPRGSIESIHLSRQARMRDGYEPLVKVDGLPCWPDRPDAGQLDEDPGSHLESHGWRGPGAGTETLVAGTDFDVAVLAVSIGMIPHVAAGLMAADRRWWDMVANVRTVGTGSAQLWLDADERELGWQGQVGVTLSGFGDSFDTWASMSHLIRRERWGDDPPRSLAYFCGALPDTAQDDGEEQVRRSLIRFLDTEVGALWPAAADTVGFRWDLLRDPKDRDGAERLHAQYLRANLDPSDRYVQSLPGSGRYRLAPGDSGFTNLALAGDWTKCGLDAGCVEAAVRSGTLAARAILEGGVAAASEGAA